MDPSVTLHGASNGTMHEPQQANYYPTQTALDISMWRSEHCCTTARMIGLEPEASHAKCAMFT